MDHSHHDRLAPGEMTANVLMNAPVYDTDDNKIGSISHLHGSGPGAEAVIDVGGFLGIGSKPVAVSLGQLDIMRDDEGEVHAVTTWTKGDLENLPEHRH
jgi:hypothetical protein